MPRRIRSVLVVDDSAAARNVVVHLLRRDPSFRVHAVARDGLEAVGLAGQDCPDLIVLDHEMPGMTGLQALPLLRERCPAARIVMWTLTEDVRPAGLVAPGTPGPRDARPVRITASGRQTYRQWLTGQLPADNIRIPVLLAVSFGETLDHTALRELLARSRADHRRRLADYNQLDDALAEGGADPWARATVSFGLAHERAVLEWFDTLPPEVRPGESGA